MSMAGKMRLSATLPVEDDFRVAGALELFEDDFVHTATGVDQSRCDDRQRSAFFDVAGRAEEALRTLQSVCVDTARSVPCPMRNDRVVGAAETGDGVEQDHHIATVFHEALGLFDHHLGDLGRGASPARRRSRDTTSPLTSAAMSGLPPAARRQEDDQVAFRMVRRDRTARCSGESTVLPVRGGATIRPRWPLPSGATRSMTRAERSLDVGDARVAILKRSFDRAGVRLSK